jgi:hypothetical protein
MFIWFRIILPELLDDILANVAVAFFDLAGDLELILRGHSRHLPPLSHEIQDELRDVTSGDWDMLDCTSDNVSLSTRDNVGNTIPGVYDCSGKGAIGNPVGRPRGSKGKYGLYSNVQPFNVE